MPDLTPEERAALREWCAEADTPLPGLLEDLLERLLDEADRTGHDRCPYCPGRDHDEGCVNRVEADRLREERDEWRRKTLQGTDLFNNARWWARAWKAAAYDLRDQRDGAQSEARFYEDGMHIADNEADALRARAETAELRAADIRAFAARALAELRRLAPDCAGCNPEDCALAALLREGEGLAKQEGPGA